MALGPPTPSAGCGARCSNRRQRPLLLLRIFLQGMSYSALLAIEAAALRAFADADFAATNLGRAKHRSQPPASGSDCFQVLRLVRASSAMGRLPPRCVDSRHARGAGQAATAGPAVTGSKGVGSVNGRTSPRRRRPSAAATTQRCTVSVRNVWTTLPIRQPGGWRLPERRQGRHRPPRPHAARARGSGAWGRRSATPQRAVAWATRASRGRTWMKPANAAGPAAPTLRHWRRVLRPPSPRPAQGRTRRARADVPAAHGCGAVRQVSPERPRRFTTIGPACCAIQDTRRSALAVLAGGQAPYFAGYCRSARRFWAQAASSCPAARGLDSPQLTASICASFTP